MAATATPVSSPFPKMPWPTYATPQTTSAKNTSERTSVPTISCCLQTSFQRFWVVACGNRSCSVGASITDGLFSASLLSDTGSLLSVRRTPNRLYLSVGLVGTDHSKDP